MTIWGGFARFVVFVWIFQPGLAPNKKEWAFFAHFDNLLVKRTIYVMQAHGKKFVLNIKITKSLLNFILKLAKTKKNEKLKIINNFKGSFAKHIFSQEFSRIRQ